MNTELVCDRQLMDVYLQQNIPPDVEMLAKTLAKVLITNMLSGIPTKHDQVFSSFIALLFFCNFEKDDVLAISNS